MRYLPMSADRNPDAFLRQALLFSLLLSWCACLLGFRVVYTHSYYFSFLAWNLVLAAVPWVAAVVFARSMSQRASRLKAVCWFCVWLAFLPNAPYIITDFMHLNRFTIMPLWYDVALLASCAGTGLLLGYCSLAEVQGAVARKFSARVGWGIAIVVLFLSGFGIYLGRFLRWNSWQIASKPFGLLADIFDRGYNPMEHPRTIGVTLVYGVVLVLGYLAMRLLPTPNPVSIPEKEVRS